ncbi:MAG: hypothetical protein LBH68_04560 [Bifidobacteriaceae bacterium]|jgi:hypothetical protein|nr:hypothetical protein [Bifidobacteriaceae bacterium]
MRRLAWLMIGTTLGVGLAVWGYRKLNAAKQAASPEGLARGIVQLKDKAVDLAAEIKQAAAEREQQLRQALLQDE